MRHHFLAPVAAIGGVLWLGLAGAPAEPRASEAAGTWTLGLRVPAATDSALRSGEGLAWDQFRRNGLTYSARGQGDVSLVMFAVTFQDGRAVAAWVSPRFDVAAGTGSIAGRHLPALSTDTRLYRVTAATRPIQGDLLDALSRDSVSSDSAGALLVKHGYLPADMTRGRRIVLFAVPLGAGSGSSTNPLFAMPERFD